MCAAEGTFDFDLELTKRSSVATILDKNSYTFNWIPTRAVLRAAQRLVPRAALLLRRVGWVGGGGNLVFGSSLADME